MGQWLGVEISPGGLARMYARLQVRSAPAIAEIEEGLRASEVVGVDETSLRQDGLGAWCWVARTDKLSLYRVELSRGRWVAESILAANFPGIVVSDFYAVYTGQGTWINALCGAHLIRDAKKVAELQPCPETAQFRDRIVDFYKTGDAAAKSGDLSARHGARVKLGQLIASCDYVDSSEIGQLQERIGICWDGITRFLLELGERLLRREQERAGDRVVFRSIVAWRRSDAAPQTRRSISASDSSGSAMSRSRSTPRLRADEGATDAADHARRPNRRAVGVE